MLYPSNFHLKFTFVAAVIRFFKPEIIRVRIFNLLLSIPFLKAKASRANVVVSEFLCDFS